MLQNFVDALKVASAELTAQGFVGKNFIRRQGAIIPVEACLSPKWDNRAAEDFFRVAVNVNFNQRACVAVVFAVNVGKIPWTKQRELPAAKFNRLNRMRMVAEDNIRAEV